ncbi:MAG: tetratricopeptide repeat protein [Pseudomonadota bacterium]
MRKNQTAVLYLAASALLATVLGMASTVLTDAPVASAGTIPPDRVVAQLQSGARYPADLAADIAAQRAAPADAALALKTARGMIAFGREQGDSRLVGGAAGVLRPFLTNANPQALYLAATARQYQHDFPGALALLDRALTLDPGDVNARLTRATIRIVQGEFDSARADCAQISQLGQPAVGFLCMATSHTLTDEGPGYAARINTILAQPGVLDAGLRPWAIGLVGEIAVQQGDTATAARAFQDVLALDPLALRERLLLADLLLATGQAAQVLPLLAPAPDTDGVLIRRVLADPATAGPMRDTLAARFALNLDLGLTAHSREEAMYFSRIAPDPALALARAKVNWELQHEIEDATLLIAAAAATGDTAAAQPVQDWMRRTGARLPE